MIYPVSFFTVLSWPFFSLFYLFEKLSPQNIYSSFILRVTEILGLGLVSGAWGSGTVITSTNLWEWVLQLFTVFCISNIKIQRKNAAKVSSLGNR